MNWIDLAWDSDECMADMNKVMNLLGSIKCWEILEWLHNCQVFRKGVSWSWLLKTVFFSLVKGG
jgi:hypothetical protein